MRSIAPTGLFGKLLGILAGTILLVLGLMFSIVLIAIVVILGILAWAYIYWKTRKIRKQMNQARQDGQVIEGEAFVVDETSSQFERLPEKSSDRQA